MLTWPHEVKVTPTHEIQAAVRDNVWQAFRLSLKGLSTTDKLRHLNNWVTSHTGRVNQIRIDNYINALLRGGQLVHRNGEIIVQR